MLSQEFFSVILRTLDVPLSIPSAQPMVTYLDSIREHPCPVREPLDFDAVLGDIAMRVEQAQANGSFRTTRASGKLRSRVSVANR